MPALDTSARTAAAADVVAPAFFIFCDVLGDPVRATTFSPGITPAGTGDADLDGFAFTGISPEVLKVGDVAHSEDGSDTLQVELSGIVTLDTELMNDLGNVTKWRGRTARLWVRFWDIEARAWAGGFVPYYTGYMWGVEIDPGAERQAIRLTIENYIAIFSAASNRTYLSQRDFDASDTSAQASISSANGTRSGGSFSGSGAVSGPPGGGGQLLGQSIMNQLV